MSSGPTSIAQINGAFQQLRGAVASAFGQTYDIRRLDDETNVSISANVPVLPAFQASLQRITSRKALENMTFDLLAFKATCNNLNLQLQDVATETGYRNDGGIFTVAQMRPLRETIWVRTESACTITRPMPTAGRAIQQPASGAVAVAGYSGVSKATEQVLTLQDGLYGFSDFTAPNLTPATVQCGLQPLNRIRDAREPKIPTALYREHFLCYIPMLPGAFINELDRISSSFTGDRYEVALMFTTDLTGLSGYICVVEKLSA